MNIPKIGYVSIWLLAVVAALVAVYAYSMYLLTHMFDHLGG